MDFNININFKEKGDINNLENVVQREYSFGYLLTIPETTLLNLNVDKQEILLLLEIGMAGYRLDKYREYMAKAYEKFDVIRKKIFQISIYLSSRTIDANNPSVDVISLTSYLPILNKTLNKFKNQIVYLQYQIELCLKELYILTFHVQRWLNYHYFVLNQPEKDYEIKSKTLILTKLEAHLIERIIYILTEEEKESEPIFENWKDVYTLVRNDVTKKILSEEKQELSKKEISEDKQQYINLFNQTTRDDLT